MTLSKHYAGLAEHFRAKGRNAESAALKSEWEHLADCYARLAEQSQSFDEAEQLDFLAELMS